MLQFPSRVVLLVRGLSSGLVSPQDGRLLLVSSSRRFRGNHMPCCRRWLRSELVQKPDFALWDYQPSQVDCLRGVVLMSALPFMLAGAAHHAQHGGAAGTHEPNHQNPGKEEKNDI